MDSTVIFIGAVVVCGVCLWGIGVVFGIAYTIEKNTTFKRPPLALVPSAEEETA